MAKILVHIVTGPESPTRVALGLLIARTAAQEGHDVRVFLAGDAVHFARPATREATHGVGTGSVAEHWAALEDAGVPIFLSKMSSDARGIAEGGEMSKPPDLVGHAVWAETILTY